MKEKITLAVRAFAKSAALDNQFVADISELVDLTSQLPLSNFDYWERLMRDEFSSQIRINTESTWKASSKPKRTWMTWLGLISYDGRERERTWMTWLDLISYDGRERERTLRTLSVAAPNTFFFSLALRRLNDWVPQVREAARDTLPKIAQSTDTKYVVDALIIILSRWT